MNIAYIALNQPKHFKEFLVSTAGLDLVPEEIITIFKYADINVQKDFYDLYGKANWIHVIALEYSRLDLEKRFITYDKEVPHLVIKALKDRRADIYLYNLSQFPDELIRMVEPYMVTVENIYITNFLSAYGRIARLNPSLRPYIRYVFDVYYDGSDYEGIASLITSDCVEYRTMFIQQSLSQLVGKIRKILPDYTIDEGDTSLDDL